MASRSAIDNQAPETRRWGRRTQCWAQMEALLCQDENLTKLDRQMAEVYSAALRALPEGDQKTERAAQRQWIKDRNAKRETWRSESRCAQGRDVKGCVTALYTVYFYNDTPIPAAVVNLRGAVQDLAISNHSPCSCSIRS